MKDTGLNDVLNEPESVNEQDINMPKGLGKDDQDLNILVPAPECTEIIGSKQLDVTANKSEEIEKVVHTLLEALNEDNALTSQEEKGRIISQYHQDDQDVVEIPINDWLTVDRSGNTPAIEAVIPIDFEDL